ncbi:MAG: glycine zipper 2TM domain-containing protein [Alphaproteobacteria bacterium]|nr:glycine zipper 2TM domain-containing protein [Alphaproteobacteria bacterium]
MKRLISLIAVVLLVGACAGDQGQKQTGGTLLGAGLGALAGSQIGSGTGQLAAVAIGALAGAYVGSEVGKSLDRADRIEMENSTQRALETAPSGQTVAWRNPDSGNSGTIVPQPAVQADSGEYCREYQQTITVGGKSEQAYGRACRQPDGSWKIVK